MMTTEDLKTLADLLRPVIEETITKELRHQRRTSAKASGLMTLAQAAHYLGVSRDFITTHKSELKPVLVGKRWKYQREDLDRMKKTPWNWRKVK